MINIGVVGFGYWGPNIVRNFTALKETSVKTICDSNPESLKKAGELYPHATLTEDYAQIIEDQSIDAVAIITPVSTHYELARKALESGKHIFVEKPFTATSKQAKELIDLADKNKLIIMVDHTFIFTGAVRRIKEVIDQGILGDLYYYDSTRVSLGLFQQDVNVIWDLAPHDFSIIDYLIPHKLISLTAQGADHAGSGMENLAYITMCYENNLMIHINVNWLSPVKVRTTLIGGDKKMLVWDDLETDEKIKIYDKGVTVDDKEGIYNLMVDYRSGDMWSPHVDHTEALRQELQYFAQCLTRQEKPINDGHAGLRIVKMLEMSEKSLKAQGQLIKA